jgi:thiamine-monophosphate kinase
MGAAPLGVLLALTVPPRWRATLMELADGIGAAVGAHRTRIVGGDVTDGDRLALAVTVLGHAARPLTRSGAKAGDTLYVTGALGGPGAALTAWLTGDVPSVAARTRFAHPEARIAAGQWLAAHGATAAIDLSDGLGGDARHLAFASGLRCVIDAEAVPRLAGVSARDVIASGEEYELLVAAPSLDAAAFRAAHAGLALTQIGRFEPLAAGETAEAVLDSQGTRTPLLPAHDHFAPTPR